MAKKKRKGPNYYYHYGSVIRSYGQNKKMAPIIIIIIIIIILVIIIIIAVVLIINQYLFLYCYIMLCFDVTSSTHYNTIRYSTMSCFKIVATAGLDEPFDALYKYSPPLDFPHETLHDCSPT